MPFERLRGYRLLVMSDETRRELRDLLDRLREREDATAGFVHSHRDSDPLYRTVVSGLAERIGFTNALFDVVAAQGRAAAAAEAAFGASVDLREAFERLLAELEDVELE